MLSWARRSALIAAITAAVLAYLAFAPAGTSGTHGGSWHTVEIANRAENGVLAAEGGSVGEEETISADGRYVAFSTYSNLLPEDTNLDAFVEDVYVRDRQSGELYYVSKASSGQPGFHHSQEPAISGTGRYIVFESEANNLVSGDTNDEEDLFWHDRQTGQTVRVNLTTNEQQSLEYAGDYHAVVSDDGRFVAFETYQNDLSPDDTNDDKDIFLRDMQATTTTLVSRVPGGAAGNGGSEAVEMTPDARFLAFESSADNLTPGIGDATSNIFLLDRQTNDLELITVGDPPEAQADDRYFGPSMSTDARYIAFYGIGNTWLHDRQLETTTIITPGALTGAFPSVSGDGRYIAYDRQENSGEIWVWDRVNNTAEKANVSATGAAATGFTVGYTTLSRDGMSLAFESFAANLVPGDNNGNSDVFVAVREGSAPTPTEGTTPTDAPVGGAEGPVFFSGEVEDNFHIFSRADPGGPRTQLTSAGPLNQVPAVSPDGSLVAFTHFDDDYQPSIWVMNRDGTNQRKIPNTDGGRDSQWLPGGDLLFSIPGDSIFRVALNGSGLTNLTPGLSDAVNPVASPDGVKIAFILEQAQESHLYVMNANGSNATPLTPPNGLYEFDPDWSPDGERITFGVTNLDTFDSDVHVINADGTGDTNLTGATPGRQRAPAFSPNGERIVYEQSTSTVAGGEIGPEGFEPTQLFMMNADGSGKTNFTQNSSFTEIHPDWAPASATPTPTPPTTATPVPFALHWGDHDCDGSVSSRDSQALLRYILQQPPLSQTEPCPDIGSSVEIAGFSPHLLGDNDCNQSISTRDNQALLRKVLQQNPLSQTEPCPDIGQSIASGTATPTATPTRLPTPTPTTPGPTVTPGPTPTDPTHICPDGNPAPIPDADGDNPVHYTLTMTDNRTITDMHVCVNIDHPWIGDLAIIVQKDDGPQIQLMNRPGHPADPDGCSGDNIRVLFDDDAGAAAENVCNTSSPAINGTYRPLESFDSYIGQTLAGTWHVYIHDLVTGDTGSALGTYFWWTVQN